MQTSGSLRSPSPSRADRREACAQGGVMRVSVTGATRRSRALARIAARASLGALVATLALAAWLIPLSTARAASLDPSTVSIDIRNPQPTGGIAEGPVGANIVADGAV